MGEAGELSGSLLTTIRGARGAVYSAQIGLVIAPRE